MRSPNRVLPTLPLLDTQMATFTNSWFLQFIVAALPTYLVSFFAITFTNEVITTSVALLLTLIGYVVTALLCEQMLRKQVGTLTQIRKVSGTR